MTIYGRQQPEVTKVGTESEVKIPVLTAMWGAISGDIVTVVLFLGRFVWLTWQRDIFIAWSWAVKWWGAWLIAIGTFWAVSFGLLFVSFAVQTIDKHNPSPRRQRDANAGLFTGWGFYKRQTETKGRDK